MEEQQEFFDVETITLPLEDGQDMECAILDEFETEGISYMVVAPLVNDTIGEETYIYRFREDGEDVIVEYIDDEEELRHAAQVYEQLVEAEEE